MEAATFILGCIAALLATYALIVIGTFSTNGLTMILRISGLVVGSYLVILALLKIAERHITKVIQHRAETPEGQRRLSEAYYAQRDATEAERLTH